jgi:phosphoribosylaminoimidazolecarboxamide formyltransferase / IMP cyclohydrolase
MTDGGVKVRTALISVSDKNGVLDFARELAALGVSLISTGGTAQLLQSAGLAVKTVEDVTGSPEMLDGRVKTLHPRIHGGLLAVGGKPAHEAALAEHDIGKIDLLVVNLYPFEAAVAKGLDFDECIENIDIGGPAMIRSAAKNHDRVTVITEPSDYAAVLEEMKTLNGATSRALRKRLAARAYARTAAYDAAISDWFAKTLNVDAPDRVSLPGTLISTMRYGENPHQSAAFYRCDLDGPRAGVTTARLIQGKELSYNNINDTDAAYELVAEFDAASGPAVAIIKHANPCGVALAGTQKDAYLKALACDQLSAFGGIIALNQTLDAETAAEIVKIFTEVIIAPDATPEAQKIIASKKNLRLLLAGGLPDPRAKGRTWKSVAGGFLVQGRDNSVSADLELRTVTKRAPTAAELADLKFAFTIAKHVKSNAIVMAKDGVTAGIGAGQMSRVVSVRIAAWKAEEAAKEAGLPQSLAVGSALASDAFFPFADSLIEAVEAGATAIIQPGGSIRDAEVIAAADERGLAMVFTGVRHFRH